jgi:hypothetical protein
VSPSSPSPGLPKVVLSSVVRSAHKGESHGGVYVVDLGTDEVEQVIDWSASGIDWEGRGGDRGLRGIAFHGEDLLLAASDEVFVYDRDFRLRTSFRNRYLKHCHEICVAGDSLFMASTGFDSALELDLRTGEFVRGYCLRFGTLWRGRRRLHVRPRPRFSAFDPRTDEGPAPGDTCHVNNVHHEGGVLYVCGVGLGTLWAVRDGRLERYASVPYGSHNARPYREGVLLNHTATDRVAYVSRRGRVLRSFPIHQYEERELVNADLPRDMARQAFGRGLAVVDEDRFVAGSSPATITLYGFDPPRVEKAITVTMDVRNAVHGLEVVPPRA